MNPLTAAGTWAVIYGLIAFLGGVLGYINKGSKPSLIAGTISGLLLLLCHYLIWHHEQTWGLAGAIVISFLLAGRFTGTLVKQRKLAASPFGTLIGKVSVVMVIGGAIMIILAVWTLTQ